MDGKTRDILSRLGVELKHVYGTKLRELRVFGSCARDEEGPESDIDVAVVLEDFARPWEEIKRCGEVVAPLCLAHDVVISLVPVREDEWTAPTTSFGRTLRRESIKVS